VRIRGKISRIILLVLLTVICAVGQASAREAAFLDPSAGPAGGDEAVKVDPKADIDVGDTVLAVAKRTSIFFVNQTNIPVKIEKIVVNSDANVTAEATANDCMKQGTIDAGSRCSVEVSVTPTTPGSWSVDILMTHNGAGRITRARLTGKTSGSTSQENKDAGLAVNSKEIKPVDFGDVTVGDGKTVRSTLMVNDSPEPITIYAIDVIEADNGLQKLDQGCAVDMELAPGASCPVTMLWIPKMSGPISTDLIIRHSGKLGFAVIPIRGNAKGGSLISDVGGKMSSGKGDIVPLPPSAQELEKEMAGKIAPVSGAALGATSSNASGDGSIHLIGTVGDRAVIFKPSGETVIVSIGEDIDMGGRSAKLVAVTARSADIVADGKRRTLTLEAASSLLAKAAQDAALDTAMQKNTSSIGGTPSSVALGAKK